MTKVGRMVCDFVTEYHTFIVHDEMRNERAVILRYEDLASLPFDENGVIETEDVVAALTKAILPTMN